MKVLKIIKKKYSQNLSMNVGEISLLRSSSQQGQNEETIFDHDFGFLNTPLK